MLVFSYVWNVVCVKFWKVSHLSYIMSLYFSFTDRFNEKLGQNNCDCVCETLANLLENFTVIALTHVWLGVYKKSYTRLTSMANEVMNEQRMKCSAL